MRFGCCGHVRRCCFALIGLAWGAAVPAARADIQWTLQDVTLAFNQNSPNVGELVLQFLYPLNTAPTGSADPLVTATVTGPLGSFECDGYQGSGAQQRECFLNAVSVPARQVSAGFAETPEPASLPLIASALAGVLLVRRRHPIRS